MSDVLLTLVVPDNLARQVQDLLLSHPALAGGFTACAAEGHGSSVPLVQPGELVSGHAPRTMIQTAGPESAMRAVLALLKSELPKARIFYWLTPIIEMGRP